MANENIQELKFQVGEAWKGVYSPSTAYGLANVVQDPTGLSIYRSLKSGNVGHPLSNASWWFRIIDLSSIKAESDRIAALNQSIAQDEALRVAAEELRQQHEAERVAAETQRNEAEQQRISAEQARVNAESARATAEQQRITAEQGRVSAESARVQAEQARVLAETLRANAEDQRAANEQNRIAAEQQRIERAEQDHQRAESDHATYVDSLGAFDISSYHATDGVLAKYADLTAALGTGGANIPDDLRKGGMSVKFVQSSDNKYVQFRYMGTSTANADFTNVANWQGVDNAPTENSKNLVESGGVANKLSLLKSVLGTDLINLTETLTWNDGYVISRTAVKQESGYSYSEPILLPKGTAINFSSSASLYNHVNQLTKAIIDGDNITYSVILSHYTGAWKSFFYILTEDTYVVFNKRNNATTTIVSLSSDAYSRLQEIMDEKDSLVHEDVAVINANIKDFLGTNFNNLTAELTWNTGRIQGSTVNTTTAYKYCNPIFLPKGTVISYTGNAEALIPENTNAVTEAIIDGENISYKSLLNLSGNWYKYNYVLEKDAYIVFNVKGSEDDTAIISFGSDFLMSLLSITIPSASKLEILKDFLGTDLVEKSVDLNWDNIGSVRGDSINTNAQYRYTNPLYVTKGTIIRFESSSNLVSAINALTKATVTGDTITSYERLYGFSESWNSFAYVVTEDCYVLFNKNISYSVNVAIYNSNSLAGIWNSLPKAIEETSIFPKKSELNEVIGTENVENILESLNLTWTNGKYIWYNRGYAERSFEVRVQEDGTSTSYCYSNIFKVTKGTVIQWNSVSSYSKLAVGVCPIIKYEVTNDDISTAWKISGELKLNEASPSFRWIASEDVYIRLCVRIDSTSKTSLKIYKSSIVPDVISSTIDSYVKYPKTDYMDLMSQAVNPDTYNGTVSEFGSGYERTQVTLLHFSDIHNDIGRIFRILDFIEKYNTAEHVIDDTIMTGDLVGSRFGVFDEEYYDSIPNFNKILLTTGNHDVYDAENLYDNPGICSTPAGTVAKEVNVSYGTDRTVFTVKMNNVNTASNPTLNISGTGAKPLHYNGSAASSSNSWPANATLIVVDEGTYYDSYNQGYDSIYLRATEKQKYDRYMKNILTWNVVQPSGAGENNYYPCYYYKDYTENRVSWEAPNVRYNQNVRLIVIDCMLQSGTSDYTTQLNWFTNMLEDARTNNLHVVVAEHFAIRTSFASTNHMKAGGFDCLIDEWGGDIGSRLTDYCNAVDTFINAGGNFVCWLCGHFHWDMVGTTTQHPKQLFIAVGSGSIATPMQHRARIVGEQSEDLFNIVAIDTFRKHVRVFRVGAQFDRFLQHAGTMCISYDTTGDNVPQLLSSW